MWNGSRLGIVSDYYLVGFADDEIDNSLSERSRTLDKSDEVLVRHRAVVRESSTASRGVHAERPHACPARHVGDLPQGGQSAARLKAGVHDDDVVGVTFDDSDAI